MITGISNWKQHSVTLPIISINLSVRQFDDENLAQTIENIMNNHGILAKGLEFEITESVFVNNSMRVKDTLAALSEVGFQISVDDFGTGESSLARLKDFDVDIIKIDKSFIDDLTINPKSLELLRCITNMAQALGLGLVVEGVETIGQLEAVQQVKCTEIQGFLFSKAVPKEQVVKLLKKAVIEPNE